MLAVGSHLQGTETGTAKSRCRQPGGWGPPGTGLCLKGSLAGASGSLVCFLIRFLITQVCSIRKITKCTLRHFFPVVSFASICSFSFQSGAASKWTGVDQAYWDLRSDAACLQTSSFPRSGSNCWTDTQRLPRLAAEAQNTVTPGVTTGTRSETRVVWRRPPRADIALPSSHARLDGPAHGTPGPCGEPLAPGPRAWTAQPGMWLHSRRVSDGYFRVHSKTALKRIAS